MGVGVAQGVALDAGRRRDLAMQRVAVAAHCPLQRAEEQVAPPGLGYALASRTAARAVCVTFAASLGIESPERRVLSRRVGVPIRMRLVIHNPDGENVGDTLFLNPCRSMALRANE